MTTSLEPTLPTFGINHTPSTIRQEINSAMIPKPISRPITPDRLVQEVKGIYAGLVMVEKKCVEIDHQQANITNKLSNAQCQALIALHRTLLHEYHDFFLASQHPSASPQLFLASQHPSASPQLFLASQHPSAGPQLFLVSQHPSAGPQLFLASQHPSASPQIKNLAKKYSMPSCIRQHSIHSFFELLRHGLPDSLDHMLAFIYLSYSMIALLKESVTRFEETWIEWLSDLARYRMAIEGTSIRDIGTPVETLEGVANDRKAVEIADAGNRDQWSGVARMWYSMATDERTLSGRIRHHLAPLARPNASQQLFYYSKALVCLRPCHNARVVVIALFDLSQVTASAARLCNLGSSFIDTLGFRCVWQSSMVCRLQIKLDSVDRPLPRFPSWQKARPMYKSQRAQSFHAGYSHSSSFNSLSNGFLSAISTLVLMIAKIPLTCATDTEHNAETAGPSGPVAWFPRSLEWMLAISIVACIAWLSSIKSTKDPLMTFCTLSCILSLAIAAVFGDVRTTPSILYPALILETFFLMRYWQDSFKTHHSMGTGCKFLIPGLGVLFDCLIVQFTSTSANSSNSNGRDGIAEGTFAQFLPFGIWLSLSVVSYAAALLGRVRIVPLSNEPHSLDELPRFERNSRSWSAESIQAG